jgi:[methyl-Co(III) methanol-specific corrinoid protein]:coenzyme M methyltransferase
MEVVMRDEILRLLNGEKITSVPAFSGLIHVTAEGLASEGLTLGEVHHDAAKMARAAASTFKLTGMPSAALPLDLCSPAEALGAELLFYNNDEMQFPQVKKLLFQSTREIVENREVENSGRIGLICDAIRLAKKDIGDRAVISGVIPGPYTLMIYICKVQNLVREMKNEPQMVLDALFRISSFLSNIGNAYLDAGADFITIHEMGGSPGFIGPKPFESFVLPALQNLTSKLPHPTVLSVCGKTDSAMSLLAQSGADAISVDQLNDLKASRAVLKDTMLFGNVDPVATLWQGNEGSVAEAVQRSKEAGVNAVWPGCDMVIQTPIQNIKNMFR